MSAIFERHLPKSKDLAGRGRRQNVLSLRDGHARARRSRSRAIPDVAPLNLWRSPGTRRVLFGSRDDARFDSELRAFLGRAYNLKAIADYETGPESRVSVEDANGAIRTAPDLWTAWRTFSHDGIGGGGGGGGCGGPTTTFRPDRAGLSRADAAVPRLGRFGDVHGEQLHGLGGLDIMPVHGRIIGPGRR